MNSSETIYIDCNRNTAEIKSDLTNEWVNKFKNGIKIPKNSQVSVQHAFANYPGLSGGSIEILEDVTMVLNITPYILHTDFNVPKHDYKPNSTLDLYDTFIGNTGLQTIMYNCFTEVNVFDLMSLDLKNKLQTTISTQHFEYSIMDQLNSPLTYGYTEQPLIACTINENGFLEPVERDVNLNIPKGIYGISQLGSMIQDKINKTKVDYNGKDYSGHEIDYFDGELDGSLRSNFAFNVKPWEFSYSGHQTLKSIMENLSTTQLNVYTQQQKRYIYIPNLRFTELVSYIKLKDHENSNFEWSYYRDHFYYASIKRPYPDGDVDTRPETATHLKIVYPITENITDGGLTESQNFWDYKPLFDGYYLGTTDFQFSYSEVESGYEMSFLHSPRRMDSHDRIGAKNVGVGQICSYMRKWKTEDLMDLIPTMTIQDKKHVKNSLINPRSRNSGVIVWMWDEYTCLRDTDKNYTTSNNSWLRWDDYFTSRQKAQTAWKTTLWYRLGFQYDQLVNPELMEVVRSFDIPLTRLYGTTTNNLIDISAQNTLASFYCPLQSDAVGDYINPAVGGYPLIPYTVLSQVKLYDLQGTNHNIFAIVQWNYKTNKYLYYSENTLFPILTSSITIKAKSLPKLSELGYFLITSDILDSFSDIVSSNQPFSLLGIIPKSNLSNQDFISSFQEIVHITSQDIVLNSIKIRILNPDLTNPKLGEKSSVIIKIVKNIQIKKTDAKDSKEKK